MYPKYVGDPTYPRLQRDFLSLSSSFQDFYKYMCEDHVLDKRQPLCTDVKSATKNATSLAVAVSLRLYEPGGGQHVTKYGSVYLASPPSMKEFVRNVTRAFKEIMLRRGTEHVRLYSLNDLRKHSKHFYRFVYVL